MPLARIDIPYGRTSDYRSAIGDVVYTAMTAKLGVPKDDRFQVITEHDANHLVIDPTYLGIKRSVDAIIIQITLGDGRSVEQKKAFYKAVADGLNSRIGLRREDVFINLVEVKLENWSLGNGIAQFAP